ncbi:hypothetical protein ECZU34_37850 [Escherichia coli]|nr:hypothetical protein ECZU34_37850 [Escherichia coli]
MAKTTKSFLALLRGGNLGVPLVILCILAMVILPLPPALLDILFTFNIVLAVMVLLVAVSAKRPLEFSLFPTILLITTLMRLTLNVASTRVVLLHGHLGAGAAGKVIESFGQVVIGGNFVVGFVVFIILMIINFIVVTKGAERISEVSARFTLDAMPGKQMAIDADLNAGLINQAQAQTRRKDVASEADFYGAMDGASKFVRGDAIAGMMILAINLIGGVCIGIFKYNLSADAAFQQYVLMTIGDGLVAQIPSLLLSTAAAIIVTRVSDNGDIAHDVRHQLLASRRCSTPPPGSCLCWRWCRDAASAIFAVQRPAWLYRLADEQTPAGGGGGGEKPRNADPNHHRNQRATGQLGNHSADRAHQLKPRLQAGGASR